MAYEPDDPPCVTVGQTTGTTLPNPVEFIQMSLDQLHAAIADGESDGYTVTVSTEPVMGTTTPDQTGRVVISVEKKLQARRRDAPGRDTAEGGS